MGTWGAGNFENDDAGDYLYSVIDQFVKVIQNFVDPNYESIGPDDVLLTELDILNEQVMPSVDILIVLCNHYKRRSHLEMLKEYPLMEWKDFCLRIYDEKIKGYGAKPDYIVKRRQVIEETFDKLINLTEE